MLRRDTASIMKVFFVFLLSRVGDPLQRVQFITGADRICDVLQASIGLMNASLLRRIFLNEYLSFLFQIKNQIFTMYLPHYADVTSGGDHLRGLALGNTAPNKRHNGGKPLATVSDLTGLEIEPQTSQTKSGVFNHCG